MGQKQKSFTIAEFGKMTEGAPPIINAPHQQEQEDLFKTKYTPESIEKLKKTWKESGKDAEEFAQEEVEAWTNTLNVEWILKGFKKTSWVSLSVALQTSQALNNFERSFNGFTIYDLAEEAIQEKQSPAEVVETVLDQWLAQSYPTSAPSQKDLEEMTQRFTNKMIEKTEAIRQKLAEAV